MDPGAANERTSLSWQRTAFTVVAVGAIVARLALQAWGWSAVAVVATAIVVGVALLIGSRRRYTAGPADSAGATAFVILAGLVVLVGVVELMAVLLR